MRYPPPRHKATLAQRAQELSNLRLMDSHLTYTNGGLEFDFALQPGTGGRRYRCRLQVWRDWRVPRLLVLSPDLRQLASGRKLPHIYRHDGPGALLCLWHPQSREWVHEMKLGETYIPWAVEWLTYFEDWLFSNDWAGGGIHGEGLEEWGARCDAS